MKLLDAIEAFIAVQASGKPPLNTMKAWRQDFSVMIRKAGWHGYVVSDLTKATLRDAFGNFAQDHAASSVRRMWSSWNALFDWLVADDIVEGNPMQAVKRPKQSAQPVKAMHDQDVEERLYWAAENPSKRARTAWAKRDYAIIATFMTTGARLEEVTKMKVMDVRGPTDARHVVVTGKGNKSRVIPVSPDYQTIINDWLAERLERFPRTRYDLKTTPMWIHVKGNPMTNRQVQYLVECIYRTAGIVPPEGAIAHAMRHTFATNAVVSGATVVEVKDLLGHASLQTTQQYLEATGDQLREAVKAHPGTMALAKRRTT